MSTEQDTIRSERPSVVHQQKQKRSQFIVGPALILFGILFALKQLELIEITWPLILMAIGLISLAGAWLTRSADGVLPGIFLFLLGTIFLADGHSWIEGGGSQNWPLVVVALGTSFIGSALVVKDRRKHWIPGAILLGSGGFLFVLERDWITWGVLNEVLAWWPVLPILAGTWFLLRDRLRTLEKPAT